MSGRSIIMGNPAWRKGDVILNVRNGQRYRVLMPAGVAFPQILMEHIVLRRTVWQSFWQWLTRKPRPIVDIRNGDPLELIGVMNEVPNA